MKPIVAIDIETGGLAWWPHLIGGCPIPMSPVIQVGAIAADEDDDLRELETLNVLVRFDPSQCSPEALSLNHYDEKRWALEAIPNSEAIAKVGNFLSRHAAVEKLSKAGRPYRVAQLLGHNVAGFDAPFLRSWFQQQGTFFPADFFPLDTISLAKLFEVAASVEQGGRRMFSDLKLATVAATLGVPLGDAHDALGDVRTTLEIYRVMLRTLRSCGATQNQA